MIPQFLRGTEPVIFRRSLRTVSGLPQRMSQRRDFRVPKRGDTMFIHSASVRLFGMLVSLLGVLQSPSGELLPSLVVLFLMGFRSAAMSVCGTIVQLSGPLVVFVPCQSRSGLTTASQCGLCTCNGKFCTLGGRRGSGQSLAPQARSGELNAQEKVAEFAVALPTASGSMAASKCSDSGSAAACSATGGTIMTGGKAIMEETGIDLEGIKLEGLGRAKRVTEPNPVANSAAKADAGL